MTKRGACLSPRLPTPPLVYFPAPHPPDPLPRWGRGTPAAEPERRLLALPLWYPAGGVPPALPARRALAVPCGGLPSLLPAYPAFGLLSCPLSPRPPSPVGKGETISLFRRGLRPRHPCIKPFAALTAPANQVPNGDLPVWSPVYSAFSLLSFPHPPYPLPGGKGEILGYFMQGASPLASPELDGTRHLQSLPNRCPGAEPAVCRDTDRSSFPMNSAGSQGEGGPGERNFGV